MENRNLVNGGGEDWPAAGSSSANTARRSKQHNRHTLTQIQQLEEFFANCAHPDKSQRKELSDRLGLEAKQVKFWFQNKRTQMKVQREHLDSVVLRQENERLVSENKALKRALLNPCCNRCRGPAFIDDETAETRQLKIMNSVIQSEINRLYAQIPGSH